MVTARKFTERGAVAARSSVGALAAGVGLAVSEFVSAIARVPSPIVAVGDLIVDVAPGSVVRRTISLLGTAQKPVLLSGIVLASLIIGVIVGRHTDRRIPVVVFLLAGLLGGSATARSGSTAAGPVIGIAAGTIGYIALRNGVRRIPSIPLMSQKVVQFPGEDPRITTTSRRGFFVYATGMTVAAGTLAVGSRLLVDRGSEELRQQVVLPAVRNIAQTGDRPVNTVPSTTVEGPSGPPAELTPWITPNDRFYRIDTALTVPRVNHAEWTLTIDGLVGRTVSFSLDDLMAMDLVDAAVTLSCVSNEVGGHLVGNAVWTGVPLLSLLKSAGIDPAAEQVMGRSVDGFTAGFPLEVLGGDRTALVAVGMNGEPLPFRHGFPARLVVAGIYGYVSAVKWLEKISLVSMEEDGFWIPRGWAKEAPIKVASRIDVPLQSKVSAGRQAVAGVAWAPVAGVAAVEVQVGDGPWNECQIQSGDAPGRSGDAWVQWFTEWDAEPGVRKLRVRAHDRTGQVQSEGPKSIAPDGAEGWHTRRVLVT